MPSRLWRVIAVQIPIKGSISDTFQSLENAKRAPASCIDCSGQAFSWRVSPTLNSHCATGIEGAAITPTKAFNAENFGGQARYSVSPVLPSGLSLDALTGVISGTPIALQKEAVYTATGRGDTHGYSTSTMVIKVQQSKKIEASENVDIELGLDQDSEIKVEPGSVKVEATPEPPPAVENAIDTQISFTLIDDDPAESVTVVVEFGEALPGGATACKVLGDTWVEITLPLLIAEYLRAIREFSRFGEPLNHELVIERCREHGLTTFKEYFDWLMQNIWIPCTEFGMKANLNQVLLLLRSGAKGRYFANVKCIFVQRIDVLAQAVS